MQGFARVFVVAAASAFTAIGCGSGRGGSGGSLAPAAPDASEKPSAPRDRKPVGVVDAQGRAIAGARVLIGQRQGVPFPNNFVAADGDGKIPAPAEWTSPQPITIEAPGFVRATYYARTPDSGDLILRPLPLAQKIALKGVTTGYGTLADDGWVHVGLVFPALARADIGQFQISNFISSETDSISVAGQTADIPSNVSIPTQRLTYLFFPVTLDKPAFRAFFDRDGAYRMVAAHARFKLSDGVSAIQGGKPFLELVDLLDFKEASLTDVRLSIAGGAANLAVNSIPFSAKSPLTAPRFDSRFAAMALAIGQDSGGRLYPSDVKRIGSGAVRQMAVPSTGAAFNVFYLQPAQAPTTGAASDQSSLLIVPGRQSTAGEFLKIPAPPRMSGGAIAAQSIVTQPPAPPAGAQPTLTYAALSSVQATSSGKIKLERKIGRWDLYAEGWATSLDLPEWPLPTPPPPGPQRWEASFAAAPSGQSPLPLGPKAFENASHVAKSAIDL